MVGGYYDDNISNQLGRSEKWNSGGVRREGAGICIEVCLWILPLSVFEMELGRCGLYFVFCFVLGGGVFGVFCLDDGWLD